MIDRPPPGRTAGNYRFLSIALGLMAVAYPASRLLTAVTGPVDRLNYNFYDDAFYYLLIAQNVADGSGSTFGSLNETNGYQPLWQLLLLPLGAAGGDSVLRLVYGLEAVLFTCFVLAAWAISKRLDARIEGAYAMAYTITVGLLFGNLFFSGMEIALVLPAALLVIIFLIDAPWYRPAGNSRKYTYGIQLGIITLVLVLSRLDAIAFPVSYALVVLCRHRASAIRTLLATAVATTVAGLSVYAIVNMLLFGSPVPVSGLAKSLGGGSLDLDLLLQYIDFGWVGPVDKLFLGAQATLVSLAALFLLRRAATGGTSAIFSAGRDSALFDILLATVLAQVIQLAYYEGTSTWPWWPWYYYFVPLQLMLGGTVLLRALMRSSIGQPLRRPLVANSVVLIACVLSTLTFARQPDNALWQTATPAVSQWLHDNTAPGDVVAIGDRAGYFTWLAERPTLQLEGLVEDVAFLGDIRARRIADRMAAEGVRYYIRGEDSADRLAARRPVAEMPGCWAVSEPLQGSGPKSDIIVCDGDLVYSTVQADDDSTWEVWHFRPELQG